MNKFTPWKIENGTLQLLPWEHGAGDVLVEVDVFEPWEGLVLAESGLPAWRYAAHSRETRDIPLRPMEYSEVLSDLFAHIDNHPETIFTLRTLHPERVREVWPAWADHACHTGDCPHSKQAECDVDGSRFHRPNVTLSALIHTQTEADQRLPVLLELASLCREVYPTCRPVERIDLIPYIGGNTYRCRCGFHATEGELVFTGGDRYSCAECHQFCKIGKGFPRIVVSGGPEPMHPDHVRDLRDQAEAAGVPFVCTGWGDWLPSNQGNWSLIGRRSRYPRHTFPDDHQHCLRTGSVYSGHMLDGKAYPWESEVKA